MSNNSFGQAFITKWQTDNAGTSATNEITIPTTGTGYLYDIYWEEDGNAANNGTLSSLTTGTTISFPSDGTYLVNITGTFPRIFFDNSGDKAKILSVEQWGNIGWTSMENAFYGCSNLQVLAVGAPNLSSVTSLKKMFTGCSTLNSDFSSWDVNAITTMESLFEGANSFNGDITTWNVSSVVNMVKTFYGATSFNQDISGWNVASVNNMLGMFWNANAFNQDIGLWTVGNVTDFSFMFRESNVFNQDIGGWNVSSANTLSNMFYLANSFNQDLDLWNVSNVTNLSSMFRQASAFNGDITTWNVSNVTSFANMFQNALAFNQDIGGWDVSSAINMSTMFQTAQSFNQPIGVWDISSVTNVNSMFVGAASFNQDLGGWDMSSVTNASNMLNNTGLSVPNYDATLIGWSYQTLNTGITIGVSGLNYCNSSTERQDIITNFSWTFIGDAYYCPPPGFITTWSTTDGTINIPTYTGLTYNYDVTWTNVTNSGVGDGSFSGQIADVLITGLTNGDVYEVNIEGQFPHFYMDYDPVNRVKLLTVEQWGNIAWESMESAFYGCTNLTLNATDSPDLTLVTTLRNMFRDCSSFNGDISAWDVSGVTSMFYTFSQATNFNQDIGIWNTGNVVDIQGAFSFATNFNQDIGGWDVSSVLDMSLMFYEATSFNQDLSSWIVSSVTNMNSMFASASSFDYGLNGWDVSNVINMGGMFFGASSFNQPLDLWITSDVTNMNAMFRDASSFNQDISAWDVGSVLDMSNMFTSANTFNQPLNTWDVSSVTSMSDMFYGCTVFNQPLDLWSTVSVINMGYMFTNASSFNQPIGSWNVSNVTNMLYMFQNAYAFNQDLSAWNISNLANANGMFLNVQLGFCYYDNMLIAWSLLPLNTSVTFSAGNTNYSSASAAERQYIIDTYGWVISDFGEVSLSGSITDASCFGSSDGAITVTPSFGTYTYVWTDGGVFSSTNATITGLPATTYTVTATQPVSGCQVVEVFVVAEPTAFVAGFAPAVFTACENQVITFTNTSDAGSTSYSWDFGDGSALETSLNVSHAYSVSGTFNVELTTFWGACSDDSTIQIVINPPPIQMATPTSVDATCGGSDGGLTGFLANGVATLSYQWLDNMLSLVGSNADLTNVPAGDYTVEVFDGSGCSSSFGPFTVLSLGAPAAPDVSTVPTSACENDSVHFLATSPVSGGTYSWSGPNSHNYTTSSFYIDPVSVADAGTYQVTVAVGACVSPPATVSFVVNPAVQPTFTHGNTGFFCVGETTPALELISIEGFNGTWSPSVIDNSFGGAFDYFFTPNSGVCALTEVYSVEINELSPTTFAFDNTDSLCYNEATPTLPSVSNESSSGTWSPSIVSNVASGVYNFTPDAGVCAFDFTYDLTVHNEIIVSPTATDEGCAGSSDGTLTLSVSGGTSPYNYSVDGGVAYQTLNTFNGLVAGSYPISIIDVLGCEAVSSATVSQAPMFNLNLSGTDPLCTGGNDGELSIGYSGGVTSSYSYTINGGSSVALTNNPTILSGYSGGATYAVVLENSSGCSVTLSQMLVDPSPLSASITTFADTCSQGVGVISVVNPLGGSTPYTFDVDGSLYSNSNISVSVGSYSVLMQDNNGCSLDLGAVNISNETISVVPIFDGPYTVCANESIVLEELVGDTHLWSGDGLLSGVSSPMPEVMPMVDTWYSVLVGLGTCSGVDSVLVSIDDNCIPPSDEEIVNNAFSPNGDGVNDVFYIDLSAVVENEANRVSILNRWGDVIRTIDNYDNYSNAWDGKSSSGIDVSNGTYVYIVEIIESGFKTTGWIQLVR